MELRHWDTAKNLKTPEDRALYLQACIEEAGDDAQFIVKAIDVVERAGGIPEGDGLMETARLLSSRTNAEHLARSLAQARAGEVIEAELIEDPVAEPQREGGA